jgi:hypothetical protein
MQLLNNGRLRRRPMMVNNSRVSESKHTTIPIKRGVSHMLGLLAVRR